MSYKIAEYFHSLQGEGTYTGTPMVFVRLSQCPVGGSAGMCTNWDHSVFVCDTGESYKNKRDSIHTPYTKVNHTKSGREVWDLLTQFNCKTLCLTGGEPLIYELHELINLRPESARLHIETSGTVIQDIPRFNTWVTVSPKLSWKKEMIERANEIKLIITPTSTFDEVEQWKKLYDFIPIFLQPLETPDPEICKMLKQKTIGFGMRLDLPVSIQLHKELDLR